MNRELDQPAAAPTWQDQLTREASFDASDKHPTSLSSQSAKNVQHSLELRIGELVLNGFAPRDRYRIADAMQRELTRLLMEQTPLLRITLRGEIAQVDSDTSEIAPGSNPETTGVELAKAIYRGLSR